MVNSESSLASYEGGIASSCLPRLSNHTPLRGMPLGDMALTPNAKTAARAVNKIASRITLSIANYKVEIIFVKSKATSILKCN
jgi:hypothetical protein